MKNHGFIDGLVNINGLVGASYLRLILGNLNICQGKKV